MSELVLRSSFVPQDYWITTQAHEDGGVSISVVAFTTSAGLTLSADDTRKLRDFLNNRLGEQVPEPSKPVKAPQLILTWECPIDGLRYTINVDNEVVATETAERLKESNPKMQIWLGQKTKQYVQPTPAYEWKEIG
jgi:hypothetical protein